MITPQLHDFTPEEMEAAEEVRPSGWAFRWADCDCREKEGMWRAKIVMDRPLPNRNCAVAVSKPCSDPREARRMAIDRLHAAVELATSGELQQRIEEWREEFALEAGNLNAIEQMTTLEQGILRLTRQGLPSVGNLYFFAQEKGDGILVTTQPMRPEQAAKKWDQCAKLIRERQHPHRDRIGEISEQLGELRVIEDAVKLAEARGPL